MCDMAELYCIYREAYEECTKYATPGTDKSVMVVQYEKLKEDVPFILAKVVRYLDKFSQTRFDTCIRFNKEFSCKVELKKSSQDDI